MIISQYFARTSAKPGVVYLVGSGPGNVGLVTMRAAALLATADVVVYDRLASSQARSFCRPDVEMVYVGKQPDHHTLTQSEINAKIIELAKQNKSVVRFKGGDPFVFGRGSEEALACKEAEIPFEIVPGISSAISVPAFAGIPITHRGLSRGFAVFTGHEDPNLDTVDYSTLASFDGTIVLLMAVGRIRGIAEQLIAGGKDPETPVAMVRWGTLPIQTELTGTLATIADKVAETNFKPPAVTVIGPVVSLGEELAWFANKPLHGKQIVIPRTRQDSSVLSLRLAELGATTLLAPTINVVPPEDSSELNEAVRVLGDWERRVAHCLAASADSDLTGVASSSAKHDLTVEGTTAAADLPINLGAKDVAIAGLSAGRGLAVEAAAQDASQPFQSVIFTSRNAVRAVFTALEEQGLDSRALAGLTIGVVGPGTNEELGMHGITADFMPETATAKSTAQYIRENPIPGPVLLPLADIASPLLADELATAGYNVTRVEAYQTKPETALPPKVIAALKAQAVDAICCTSSSTIRNLVGLLDGSLPEGVKIIAIGPSTAKTCADLGVPADVVADVHTVEGLVQATVQAFS